MKIAVAACAVAGVLTTSAGAIELDGHAINLAELGPCKAAAERLCDASAARTWESLLRCGATLAANSLYIGNSCRAVLKKYGQL
jgi:hypothetical protein